VLAALAASAKRTALAISRGSSVSSSTARRAAGPLADLSGSVSASLRARAAASAMPRGAASSRLSVNDPSLPDGAEDSLADQNCA
jgi:hypothetical protein